MNNKNTEKMISSFLDELEDNPFNTPEDKIRRTKEDFLRNKFRSEIENLKYGTMQEYLKYYFKFFKAISESMTSSSIFTLFEVLNGTNEEPNVIVFSNGGHSQFDVYTFKKGVGKDFLKHVPVYASLIDGEFKINSDMYVPHHLYNENNYEFVLEHF